MSTKLTDKNYCIMMMGGYKIYVNEKGFEDFKAALKGGAKFIEIGKKMINTSSVMMATHASDVERTEREKKGDWKCEHGEWHRRGEECAHGLLKKINAQIKV